MLYILVRQESRKMENTRKIVVYLAHAYNSLMRIYSLPHKQTQKKTHIGVTQNDTAIFKRAKKKLFQVFVVCRVKKKL